MSFSAQVQAQPSMRQLERILPLLVAHPVLHARFVNTLARMEYVGVRKILKARHVEMLDQEGLQHIVEEASHALRLKKAAHKLCAAERKEEVATFSASHTLGGPEAEQYLQEIDHACEELVRFYGFPEAERREANYLLSSLIIEIRAQAFYPLYERHLKAAAAPFSVRSILKDEKKHLQEMEEKSQQVFGPTWCTLIEDALRSEAKFFAQWVQQLAQQIKVLEFSA